MKIKITLATVLLVLVCYHGNAQDTFSIVAVDPITGEVGSAGASCVDMDAFFPNYSNSFIGELVPGVGAINTQSYYLQANQINATDRMMEGDSPAEIIEWLAANDAQGNASQRQYGVAGIVNGEAQAAAFTGANCFDWKGHITGPHYAIQGNILLGEQVLEQMEANFLNAEGDLACKLMAALQGANIVGADTRCADNETSALFAYIKVAQADDPFGTPSFEIGVRTGMGEMTEPIDLVQAIFDETYSCSTGVAEQANDPVLVFPNPFADDLHLSVSPDRLWSYTVLKMSGEVVSQGVLASESKLDLKDLPSGIYLLRLESEDRIQVVRLVHH